MGDVDEGKQSVERLLTLFERVLYHVNVMITARISGPMTEQQIKHALARIQAKHTVLRCQVIQEEGRLGFHLQKQPEPIPLVIVKRHTERDWLFVSYQQSLQRFDDSKKPLARFIWLQGERASELLLVCSHAICDGRSLVLLLQEILRLCDDPQADIGNPTTLNGLHEVFPLEILADRRLRRHIRWKAAVKKLMLRFPRRTPVWSYGKIYRHHWTLDMRTSQQLVRRCKAENTTVFAALSLACILACRLMGGLKHIEKFEVPVDFRRYLPHLRRDSLFAIAPTITLSLRELQKVSLDSLDFWLIARALKADIVGKMEALASTVYTFFLGIEHFHNVYEHLAAYAQSQAVHQKVSLSYMGKVDVDQTYQQFHLLDICDISAMMTPTPANLLVMYSFKERFHFSFSSDESSLPYEQALELNTQITTLLHACLARLPQCGSQVLGALPTVRKDTP